MKIAQILNSESWGEISPERFKEGIGGREGALLKLSEQWAKLGHEVTNFVPTKKASRFQEQTFDMGLNPKGYHEYLPINLSRPLMRAFPYDACIAWECPSVYADDDVKEKQPIRLVHMQVAHLEDRERDAAEEHSTGIVFLSEWAKNFMVHEGLQMNPASLHVRPNGVTLSDYPLERGTQSMFGPNLVYSSSPDRGLVHLLKMWPDILSRHKNAKLYVAYGLEKYIYYNMWFHEKVGEMCVELKELIRQPGVIDVDKIGHKQLAALQMSADLWVYPCDPIQATETGCITAIENMAAMNPCITTNADCLEDEFGTIAQIIPLPFNKDAFVERLLYLYEDKSASNYIANQGREFAASRDWGKIAPTWIDLFREQNAKA